MCLIYNLTLFSLYLYFFFWAATAFDIFGFRHHSPVHPRPLRRCHRHPPHALVVRRCPPLWSCGCLIGALSLATAHLCRSHRWLIVVCLLSPSPSSPSLVHHPCRHRLTRRRVTSRHIMGALLLIGIVAGWWDASRNDAIIVSYLMISRDVREF